jgi:hypothetical protein
MEALHLRAQLDAINLIIKMINKVSQDGQEIEIIDNTVFEKEQQMIFKALAEEEDGETFDHNSVWSELLEH